MTFKALTASAHIKAVTVDGISVNSVSLDQDPFSQTARLLVAAGVGISQRSGNVIARYCLPIIPTFYLHVCMSVDSAWFRELCFFLFHKHSI